MNSIEIKTALSDADRTAIIKGVVDAIRPLLERQPQLVDGDKIAMIIGVSRATIDRLVATGKLPSITIGRRRLYRPDECLDALSRMPKSNRGEAQ